jgi:NAD(P)H-hydrate repair Nnr-like enzyme with NAD(P)H-hydrate dehydratase domain
LAQGLSKIDAARFSVAIHGAAGDKFSKNKGGRGLTATKLIKIINEEML